MIAVSYHDTVNVLQGIAATPSGPFERPEWFALLAEQQSGITIAFARDEDVAVGLPLLETRGHFEALRNWYSFIWRPLGGDHPGLMEAVAHDLRSRTHRVTLWPVPDEDGSASRVALAFCKAGWSVCCQPCDHNHVLPVQGRSFAEYWAARPGHMRSTHKRKAKKVAVEILDRFDADAWASYEAIYRESWKPDEGASELLRRFAKAEGAAGRIRLGVARAQGEPVAAQFWTVENGIAYIHKLAHRESAKALSAGTTLSAALFERVIDVDKVNLVDFGTGNDTYKADWMELDRPRYRIDCLDPSRPRAWPALAKRVLARSLRPG